MIRAHATREKIVRQAAELFNQQGYAGASMSDVVRVTGLQKGGIYNHFKSKDELAIAAFDYAAGCFMDCVQKSVARQRTAIARLQKLVDNYRQVMRDPPLPGGCPLLNTAIESDDTHPALRDRTRAMMAKWLGSMQKIVERGIDKGEIRPEVEPEAVATAIVAGIEGGVMLSKLYADPSYLERALAHLDEYIVGLSLK
ncbi:MAG: TetR/AcrR family transcriptional regulator [Cyanobacteria bacterium J06641_5]